MDRTRMEEQHSWAYEVWSKEFSSKTISQKVKSEKPHSSPSPLVHYYFLKTLNAFFEPFPWFLGPVYLRSQDKNAPPKKSFKMMGHSSGLSLREGVKNQYNLRPKRRRNYCLRYFIFAHLSFCFHSFIYTFYFPSQQFQYILLRLLRNLVLMNVRYVQLLNS